MTEPARAAFEAWISAPPFELEIDRFPADERRSAWPGAYRHYPTELAWEAWQEASRHAQASAACWPASHHVNPEG